MNWSREYQRMNYAIDVLDHFFRNGTKGNHLIGIMPEQNALRVLRHSLASHMNQRTVPTFPPSTTRLRQFRKSVYAIFTI